MSLGSSHVSLVSCLIDRVGGLISDEFDALRVRLTNVIATWYDSLKLDLQSVMQLLGAPERGDQVSTVYPETSETRLSTSLGLCNG